MTAMMRRDLLGLGLGLAFGSGLHAQESFPSRPITFVVPFPPGSTTDVAARAVAQKLTDRLGGPVVVDNRAGANGAIGIGYVARGKADGYTLVIGSAATHTVGAALAKGLPYDPIRDFAPVANFGVIAPLVTVHAESPANRLDDLVRMAKEAPGKLNYGVSSQSSRLLGELFKQATGTQLADIPYKGPAEVATDLLARRIDVSFEAPGAVLPHILAGKLKALATTGAARSGALPQVPTVAEAGRKALEFEGFVGVFAPAGTPTAVLDRLHDEIARAAATPEVAAQLARMGMEAQATSRAAFAARIARDAARFTAVARAAGLDK
jgi:tripartite-type tricarboxylate transporter receptor subunit TctC